MCTAAAVVPPLEPSTKALLAQQNAAQYWKKVHAYLRDPHARNVEGGGNLGVATVHDALSLLKEITRSRRQSDIQRRITVQQLMHTYCGFDPEGRGQLLSTMAHEFGVERARVIRALTTGVSINTRSLRIRRIDISAATNGIWCARAACACARSTGV